VGDVIEIGKRHRPKAGGMRAAGSTPGTVPSEALDRTRRYSRLVGEVLNEDGVRSFDVELAPSRRAERKRK
jgi:hypothetical protein